MSPCASDSAELPPCRTEQVRHHCLNPGSIPKNSLSPSPSSLLYTESRKPPSLGFDRTKHSPAVPLPGPGALLHVSDKIMV